jgi:group I intron endonuclease
VEAIGRVITVYRLISPSGKSYIGQTKRSARERFGQHVNGWKKWASSGRPRRSYQTKLYYAFDKWTPDGWVVEVLGEYPDQASVDEAERIAIDQFDSIVEGYNLTEGGQGLRGLVLSDEHKRNQSEARKRWYETEEGQAWKERLRTEGHFARNNPGRVNHPQKGKPLSEEHKAKIAAAKKGKPSPLRGQTRTPEQRKRISDAKKLQYALTREKKKAAEAA